MQRQPRETRSSGPGTGDKKMNGPFTEKEQKVMDALVSAHNAFSDLEKQHPDEVAEFTKAIHDAQNILGWRILRRDYPETFPVRK
jgi:acyl-CoA reductase-like NAD-dependent aldehyde dehydrogenase